MIAACAIAFSPGTIFLGVVAAIVLIVFFVISVAIVTQP